MAAVEFVRYNSQGEVVDVEEFEVARAILAGDTHRLSQQIESKYLFELCMTFGHQSTAAALLNHGVPGCRVEVWYLGPFAAKARSLTGACRCGGTWDTCACCCWGSEVEDGVWMKDWDAKLTDTVAAAQEAAEWPVARTLLAALKMGEDFSNYDVSEAAMARLLDLAILTGDAELAQQCAQRCTRPLRRWRSEDLFHGKVCMHASELDVMAAAILSGVALQGLSIRIGCHAHVVPFREAIALCGDLQLWQRLGPRLPEGQGPWIPEERLNSAALFLSESDGKHELCLDRIRTASLANMALSEFVFSKTYLHSLCPACEERVGTPPSAWVCLLDVAIYFGQSSACAELLASCGVASTAWTREACLPDRQCDRCGVVAFPYIFWTLPPLGERRAAAGAALRAALSRAERLAAPIGLGIYQAMLVWARGKKVPKALVNIVLSFAAERPRIACVLEGLEEEVLQAASLVQEQEHEMLPEVAQAPEPAEARAAPDVETEGEHAEQAKSTDDLLTAVRNSRDETVPLSPDGVICFRLTRKANAPHVNELLFDASGPLAELHQRVLDTGCEVAPEWSPVKALFVPLTQAQLLECRLACTNGCFVSSGLMEDQHVGTCCARCRQCCCDMLWSICVVYDL